MLKNETLTKLNQEFDLIKPVKIQLITQKGKEICFFETLVENAETKQNLINFISLYGNEDSDSNTTLVLSLDQQDVSKKQEIQNNIIQFKKFLSENTQSLNLNELIKEFDKNYLSIKKVKFLFDKK